MATMLQVRNAQPDWFSPGNKRFLGDKSYEVRTATSGTPYLVRSTYAWSDMFGKPKTLRYRLNPIGSECKIEPMLDEEFYTLAEVKAWLNDH